jgi:predicted aconitase
MIEDRNMDEELEELELDEELEPYEELTEEDQEIVDEAFDSLEDLGFVGCPHCAKNELSLLYLAAFKNGENNALLALSDSLRGIVEDNN